MTAGDPGTLRELLTVLGVTEAEVEAAIDDGTLMLLAVERFVFEDRPTLNIDQMLEATPFAAEHTSELWRSLGFPDPPEGEPFFTDADLEIVSLLAELVEVGAVDPELLVGMARVAGQSMARFAAAEIELIVERSTEMTEEAAALLAQTRGGEGPPGPGADDQAPGSEDDHPATEELVIETPELLAEPAPPTRVDPEVRRLVGEAMLTSPEALRSVTDALPAIPKLLEYVWRRNMQAAARNRLLRGDPDVSPPMAIGFADLVGFTSLSQQISATDLSEVVDRFERIANDTVASLGGRVIKMIGDEVMFSVGDPRQAIEVGLELAATYREDDELSDVRVGVSWGAVLQREGDCFGPVVNTASRIVNVAFPGSVVVSDELHELVGDDPELVWRSLRRKNLKDIGRVVLWSVERADADQHAPEVRDRARVERSQRVERAVERITSTDVLSKEARVARREALRQAKRDAESRARRARRDIEERAREALKRVDDQARRAKREVEEQAKAAKRDLDEQTRPRDRGAAARGRGGVCRNQ